MLQMASAAYAETVPKEIHVSKPNRVRVDVFKVLQQQAYLQIPSD